MLKRAKKINQNQQMATCKVFVIPNKYKESPTIYHHKKFGCFDFKDAENNLESSMHIFAGCQDYFHQP